MPTKRFQGCGFKWCPSLRSVQLYILARHAESTLNFEQRINGDPAVPVDLTHKGREEAALLGQQIRHVPIELCVHTRFERTLETASIALEGREVPVEVEPLLDDIDVGELEGVTLDQYRAWKHEHTRRDAFPGGESLDDAARRYAAAFEKLLERPEQSVLIVTHEIPLRYAINAADSSDDLDGPAHQLANATPYVFDETALGRAVQRIREIVGSSAQG
jgi:broad specificity phosphatase PhoE